MLVLTRKVGEVVVIGGYIRVTVVGIRGRQVRLGFTAPMDTAIHREERCGSPDASCGAPPVPACGVAESACAAGPEESGR
jgi:carbon storage regulator